MTLKKLFLFSSLAVAPMVALAQDVPTSVTTKIAVRKLGPTVRASAITFGGVQHVRRLSDGRVLVNDPSRHQVLLLDSTLANPVVVIDSVGGKDNSYGLRQSGIVPYKADSTFFVDPTSSTLLLIDPNGKIAKVMSMPTNAVSYLASPNSYGYPGYSEAFGIVFRMQSGGFHYDRPMPPEGAPPIVVKYEDSVAIVGMKLSTRRGDTVVKYGSGQLMTMRISWNNFNNDGGNDLWVPSNDWAMMSDGSIALLSGREYRLRFVDSTREKTDAPRLPFTWDHNPDDEKMRIADSINTGREKNYQERVANFEKQQAAAKDKSQAPAKDGKPVPVPTEFRPPQGTPRPPTRPDMVSMTDVPDYFPAYERSSNSFRADEDNRLWIRPRPPKAVSGGGLIYDIVDRKGELIDRVQLPAGRTLIGFGRGGIVYLLARDAGATRLEQAKFK